MGVGDEAAERGRYHHGDLKRVLLTAARDEVAASGAAGLSLASLARRAGVSQSAPYRHFPDRDALLAEVAAEGFTAFAEALVEGAEGGGAEEMIPRMAVAYVRFGQAHIELYRLMFASRTVPEAAKDSPLAAAAWRSFELLLQAAVARHGPGDAERRATAIWAQLHGLVMLKADGFLQEPLETMVAALGL